MRYEITDEAWAAIKPILPNEPRGVPQWMILVSSMASSAEDGGIPMTWPKAESEGYAVHALLQVRHDGQFAHITHAQIARRVILSQTSALVSSGKSVALVRASRARYQRRFAIVTKRGAGCDGRRRHQL